jgi:hypothetical protein
MKKLLLLPLLMITFFCFAQDAKVIIGKPVKIGNLLVAQNDFPHRRYWKDAIVTCAELGKGWRLPTKDELNMLYQNKDKIGGFARTIYCSSTQFDASHVWYQSFNNGNQIRNRKTLAYYVRAVKSL